tara:strand:- start:446 stop:685 length:240 start_codon:yes stop_codon:yes gene_type:complete
MSNRPLYVLKTPGMFSGQLYGWLPRNPDQQTHKHCQENQNIGGDLTADAGIRLGFFLFGRLFAHIKMYPVQITMAIISG